MSLIDRIKNLRKIYEEKNGYRHDTNDIENIIVSLLTLFSQGDGIENSLTLESHTLFCREFSIVPTWSYKSRYYPTLGKRSDSIMAFLKKISNNTEQFLYAVTLLLNLEYETEELHEYIVNEIDSIFSQLNTSRRLIKQKGTGIIMIISSIEPELDKQIIDKALSFLDLKSNEEFVEALKGLSSNSNQERLKAIEKLRRTIEEFLRYKLGNNANFNNNTTVVSRLLKQKDINKMIIKEITSSMAWFESLCNEHTKHGSSSISSEELEYLVYYVGNILKYLDTHL